MNFKQTKKQKSNLFFLLFFCSIPFLSFTQVFTPGESYLDTTGYVEYLAGNLPIVISVPHGGYLEPTSIPDRECTNCSYLRDAYTQDIGRGVYNAFYEQTGCYPHMIINLLHRKKFDANRAIGDAADGNPIVEQAWFGYHEFIDSAKAQIIQDYDRGLFLDFHGHSHTIQRIELGYLLTGSELREEDAILNTTDFIEESSIQTLVEDNLNNLTHSLLLRGSNSLGTLFDDKGFPAVPSMSDPFPEENEMYWSGGYNTARHGSGEDGGNIDGVQVEMNQDIRFDEITRAILIDSMTFVINEYVGAHYDEEYFGNYCNVLTNISEATFINDIVVFPNPANDILNIKSDLDELNISIYNCLGQEVSTQVWSGDGLDISFLKSGSYFIQFRKEELILETQMLMKY